MHTLASKRFIEASMEFNRISFLMFPLIRKICRIAWKTGGAGDPIPNNIILDKFIYVHAPACLLFFLLTRHVDWETDTRKKFLVIDQKTFI